MYEAIVRSQRFKGIIEIFSRNVCSAKAIPSFVKIEHKLISLTTMTELATHQSKHEQPVVGHQNASTASWQSSNLSQ